MRVLFTGLVIAAGCNGSDTDSDQGVAVGNPGTLKMRMAPSEGVETYEAGMDVAVMALEDCEGGSVILDEEFEVGLRGNDTWIVPTGVWCSLNFEAPGLYMVAEPGEEAELEIVLRPHSIDLSAPTGFEVDGPQFVAEFGDLNRLDDEFLREFEVISPKTKPKAAEQLGADLQAKSALFIDRDEDGEIGAEDRQAGPVAGGADRQDEIPERPGDDLGQPKTIGKDGCGGYQTSLLLFPLAFGFSAVSRRRTRKYAAR